jgi:hypothetical protein
MFGPEFFPGLVAFEKVAGIEKLDSTQIERFVIGRVCQKSPPSAIFRYRRSNEGRWSQQEL